MKSSGLKRAFCAGAALLSFSMLFGCQAKLLDPQNPVSIEIWHYYNGPQKLQFDSMVAQFNDTVGMKQGITVEAYSQGNVNELTQQIIDSANKKVGADEIPDIFAAYADTAYQIDSMGLVAPLDPYLSKAELEEYIPGYIEEGRFDVQQSLKIFPVAKSSEVLMLNKTDWDRFASATGYAMDGLDTLEGIAAAAQAYYTWTDSLTPVRDDGKAFFGRDAMANYFIIGSKQLGVDLFSVTDGVVHVRTDEAVMRRLWDCFYVPYINGYFTANGRFRSDDAKVGDVIALVGSTAGAAYFPAEVTLNDAESYPITFLALPSPCFEGAQQYAVQQGAGMVVAKSTQAKEYAATVFLKWFTDVERNLDFSIGSGYLPVKKAANDPAQLSQTIARAGLQVTDPLKDAISIGMGMTQTYQFYTAKAFAGGTQARAVLENSLLDRAKRDEQRVQAAVDAGTPRAQAALAINTPAAFAEWLTGFRAQLGDAVR